MPYTVEQENGEYCVYKVGEDGGPTGEALGCHDTAEEAGQQIGAIERSEAANMQFACNATTGQARREMLDGREYLVVPVVALKPGVLNSELVPMEEAARHIKAWNGRPWVIDHPMDDEGNAVSANDPAVLERQRIGWVFNADWQDGRVKAEVWTDVAKANATRKGQEVLRRLEANEPLEVSTAYFRDIENHGGTFEGRQYYGVARNLKPDHLAALPNDVGACSWADGCGAPRINEKMYQPPEAAKNNAARVLRWREEHGDEVKGMTRVGWTRARQLASGDPISLDIVKRMAQFNRHRKNAEVAPEFRDEPWKDAGHVAWLGWGGTTGVNWAIGVSESEEAANEMNANIRSEARRPEYSDTTSADWSAPTWNEEFDRELEMETSVIANLLRKLADFGYRLIKPNREVRMSDIQSILDCECAPFTEEELKGLSDESVSALAALVANARAEEDDEPQEEPQANDDAPDEVIEEGAPEFDLEAAIDGYFADVGGIAGVKEALASIQANADERKEGLVKELAANTRLGMTADELRALPESALEKLAASFKPRDFSGRGGGPQVNDSEIKPLKKTPILSAGGGEAE